jgi:hypothetical protein
MTSWHSPKRKKGGDARDPLVTRALNPIGLDINSLSDASPALLRHNTLLQLVSTQFHRFGE